MMDVHCRAERKEMSEEKWIAEATDCLYVSEGITLGMSDEDRRGGREGRVRSVL